MVEADRSSVSNAEVASSFSGRASRDSGAAHTPGPWTLGASERHIWVGGGPNNDDVAEFNFSDEHTVKISREEAIANAQLFLSAPALLAACKRALNYIENTEGELGVTLDSGDALRVALAKATGSAA